jgi:hypothetical protein
MVHRRRHIRWQGYAGCDCCAASPKCSFLHGNSVDSRSPVVPHAGTIARLFLNTRTNESATAGRTGGSSRPVAGTRGRGYVCAGSLVALNRDKPWTERRKAPLPREELPEEGRLP